MNDDKKPGLPGIAPEPGPHTTPGEPGLPGVIEPPGPPAVIREGDPVFLLAGSTPATPGVAEGKVCDACDGDGLLENADGSRVLFCDHCNGTGGTDPEAVDRARRFSAAYKAALFDDDDDNQIADPPTHDTFPAVVARWLDYRLVAVVSRPTPGTITEPDRLHICFELQTEDALGNTAWIGAGKNLHEAMLVSLAKCLALSGIRLAVDGDEKSGIDAGIELLEE